MIGGARLISVPLLYLAGLLLAPLSFAYLGELTPQQVQELDQVKKRLAPTPYVPANAPGCDRWKGRAFLGSPGAQGACTNGCALLEVDHGRYEVSGAACGRAKPPIQQRAEPAVNVHRCVSYVRRDGQVREFCGPNPGPGQPSVTSHAPDPVK